MGPSRLIVWTLRTRRKEPAPPGPPKPRCVVCDCVLRSGHDLICDPCLTHGVDVDNLPDWALALVVANPSLADNVGLLVDGMRDRLNFYRGMMEE